ncbi:MULTISPECIES: lanthionine synthetase C family protein [Streptomyces]|uniref:lanthionine synthetase C family protein n=1 Tax=Streptomyces TaxID=1883 RepID=UPI000699DA17|nr:lanthionine synthetase C family protein [Streptomyces kasugaensis]MYU54333.1 hypothetical protein [Streptomyces sp. SID7805]
MTPTVPVPRHRDRALALVDTLADRLRDPARLPHATTGTEPADRWKTTSLASGYAGISLLFSSRSDAEPDDRRTAHRYLGLAADSLKSQPRPHYGLFYEIAGLGFALDLAHRAGGGYAKALASLDARAAEGARGLCHVVETVPLGPMARFDVLDGLAGLGRYLLLRGLGGSAEMERILTALAAMLGTTEHVGRQVPRYWSTTPPNWYPTTDRALRESGHLNLGLAHGIAGPLALLSLAHRQGAVTDGQEEAIRRLVGLLDRFRQTDEYGVFWPHTVSLDTFEGNAPGAGRGRVAWCYGTPGISRALQLAGQALGREDWLRLADDSIGAVAALPLDAWRADHWSLCHGWAGVLHLLRFFTDGPVGARADALIDTVAERILDGFDTAGCPPLEIGHDGLRPGNEPAGFLEGAAGLALALDSYARPGRTLPWDTVLMVN